MKASKALVLLLICLPTTRPQCQSRSGPPATLILSGGKIFTADSLRPWAEALAIRGERIVAVGTTAEVRRWANKSTREIPLEGRVVIPGINDAHDHLAEAALGPEFRVSASPTPDPSSSELLDSLRAFAGRSPNGAWIRAAVGARVLADSTIDRAALDRAAPGHPVVIHGWWGHGMVLNSDALRALGVAEDVPDPLGGWYGRDANGRLTGRVDEYAKWGLEQRLGALQPENALVASLRAFADSSLRLGVTSVQNMAGFLPPALTVRLFREAQLPLRVRLVRWSTPTATSMNVEEWAGLEGRLTPRLLVDGRKWVFDGTPIEQLALQSTPYPGRPGWYGRLEFPVDSMRAILAQALAPNAPQLHLHVVGDSTTKLVLDMMQSLAPDSVWRTRRVRFEHGTSVTGPLVARVARLGVVIAQPRPGAFYRSWRAAGIPVAYGSDMLRNPFLYMMYAITGTSLPQEAISREEAVRMLTSASADAERTEREKGTLTAGMLADVSVLSQDIFSVPPQALPGTRSVLTLVGGDIVYDGMARRAAAASSP